MSIGEAIAIIGGSGGLSGALNFAILQYTNRTTRDRDKAFQALQVAEHLENYAFGCAGHAFADWVILEEGRPGALLSQPPWFPPFSDKIAWTSLDASHSAASRRFPAEVELAISAVQAGFRNGAIEGFNTALFWTLKLGEDAFNQASFLREANGIAALDFDYPKWDYPTFLRGEMEKLDIRKGQMVEYHADKALPG